MNASHIRFDAFNCFVQVELKCMGRHLKVTGVKQEANPWVINILKE